jgi:hypothetical protein
MPISYNSLLKQPNLVNADTLPGVYKGVVEDVRDPFGLGRVRVRCYALHGDYKNTPVEHLPWCEPAWGTKGAFAPPELFDRVWIMFEAGNKYNPVWIGYWYSIPAGRGKLPYSKRKGSEIPMPAWGHFNDLYPEMNIIAKTNEGSYLYSLDKIIGSTYHGEFGLRGAGSGSMFFSFYKKGQSDYAPQKELQGDLEQQRLQDQKPINELPWIQENFSGAMTYGLNRQRFIIKEAMDTNTVINKTIHHEGGHLKHLELGLNHSIKSDIVFTDNSMKVQTSVEGISYNELNVVRPKRRWND